MTEALPLSFSFLFFFSFLLSLGSRSPSSPFFVLSRGRVIPELSDPRHSKLDDLIMHHLRDRHFAETTLRRLSTRPPPPLCMAWHDWQTSFNRENLLLVNARPYLLTRNGYYVLPDLSVLRKGDVDSNDVH